MKTPIWFKKGRETKRHVLVILFLLESLILSSFVMTAVMSCLLTESEVEWCCSFRLQQHVVLIMGTLPLHALALDIGISTRHIKPISHARKETRISTWWGGHIYYNTTLKTMTIDYEDVTYYLLFMKKTMHRMWKNLTKSSKNPREYKDFLIDPGK